MAEARRHLIETPNDSNVRLTAEAAIKTVELLEKLVENQRNREFDYCVFEQTGGSRVGFTLRIGRKPDEHLSDWLARQKAALDAEEVLRGQLVAKLVTTPIGKQPPAKIIYSRGEKNAPKSHGLTEADIEAIIKPRQ